MQLILPPVTNTPCSFYNLNTKRAAKRPGYLSGRSFPGCYYYARTLLGGTKTYRLPIWRSRVRIPYDVPASLAQLVRAPDPA